MPRKPIVDALSCKFSIDISGDNKRTLDSITAKKNIKYGPAINAIIRTLCCMPNGIKNTLTRVCESEYKRLNDLIANTDEGYFCSQYEEERDFYLEMLTLMHGGNYRIETTETMKKIRLLDGYLIIPNDWIVLNPERAEHSRYAAVLEARNYVKFGVPHFVYFNNFQYAGDYTDHMKNDFMRLCRKAWDGFANIEALSNKNQLVPDPENPGTYLNIDANLKAPIIGLFGIDEQGDRYKKYPHGAKIVRDGEFE